MFGSEDWLFRGMSLIPIIIFGFALCIFIFVFVNIFSKRGRSRWIGKQLDIQRQVLEDNKDVIMDLRELGSEMNIKSQRNVMETYEDDLRFVSNKQADIEADAIRKKAAALKQGFEGRELKYCKYCGASVDIDAIYCSKCGKRL